MIANEVITLVKEARPGVENEMILKWIREQERKISRFISRFEGYEDDLILPTEESDTLYIPEEYSDIYVLYCLAKIDFSYGETTDYHNDMIMYNLEWQNWTNSFISRNMPKVTYMGGI